ncbi:MAG: HAD-IIB family hydrolase [Bacteroidota bacterium]
MRYMALATDYDGTLAKDGHVDKTIIDALGEFKSSGRKLILVTGRELPELLDVFPEIDLFDIVVAENGALLYDPATHSEKLLCEPPKEELVKLLKKRNVDPMSVGRAIIATWKPFEKVVLEAIRDIGLEMQVIFNKDAVMVLPSGINKASGLQAALKDLQLSPHNIAAIGDAENDHAFLSYCEFSAVVSNALTVLKDRADYICMSDHGAGVIEFMEKIMKSDLAEYTEHIDRHRMNIGTAFDGSAVQIDLTGVNIMLAGSSGGGKSTLAGTLLENLINKKYQFCIIDPEGDYKDFPETLMSGSPKKQPEIEEIIKILQNPDQNCVVSLVGQSLDDRPRFFEILMPSLVELRIRTGRPHWIIIDETHHVLHSAWARAAVAVPSELSGMIYLTIEPGNIAPAVLSSVDILITVGQNPKKTMGIFAEAMGVELPAIPEADLQTGQAILWNISKQQTPFVFTTNVPEIERHRHVLKYVEGELPQERSFYFRGPENKLKLRAQNLMIFLQIGEGVDDDTWMYHLKNGDYSEWFRIMIKDEDLAGEAWEIENRKDISAEDSRKLIRQKIESRYTIAG